MNDQELVQKLKLLKNLRPSEETLLLLKNRVVSDKNKKFDLFTFFEKPQIRLAFSALVLILLIFGFSQRDFLTGQVEFLTTRTQIALSANQLEKSKVALSAAKDQLARLNSSETTTNQLKLVGQFIDETNSNLNSLDLAGEKGKYTNKECLTVYHDYESFLASASKENNVTKDQNLVNKISSYNKQARVRLQEYEN